MRRRVQSLSWVAAAVVGLGTGVTFAEGSPSAPAGSQQDAGRRLYREGLLPDGTPLRAERPEGFALEGERAACVSCHRPSGMGSVEGSIGRTILVAPVAGPVLFEPARFHGVYLNRLHHWVPNDQWARVLTRGAYDEAALARSLREGLDPDGRRLLAPMPRYELDDAAVSALAAYLRTLSAQSSPGVEAETLHLATVTTPDAPPGQAEAVLGVLRAWSDSARASGQAWFLHAWELSGAPESWRRQLDARYRERPVFAVLSGAGGAEWAPVHRFCEEWRVPCVLPSVDVAPESRDGFYSVYFSPGVLLEARVLARSLARSADGQGSTARIVQIDSDASGRRAGEALGRELGGVATPLVERRYRLTAPGSVLAGLSRDDTLILWLRPSEIEQLAAAAPEGPAAGRTFLSAFLAPPESVSLPPSWKARATWVSLFDDLGVQGRIAKLRLAGWLERSGLPLRDSLRAEGDAYAASYLFAASLAEIRAQEARRPRVPLGREHLLEALETQVGKYSDGTELVDPDAHVAFYGRMSLGPGQRTAVRGGVLLRYASPESDELVALGSRVVP
jgi:hypothetical protein